jgi:hypothetical protein
VQWDRELRSSAEAVESARSESERGGIQRLPCHVIDDYTFTSYYRN